MKTSEKILHWAPRIICILAILFISMFAADSFAPGLTIWQQLGAFFMHLIPSFILLIILIISWKKELFGGIFFTAIGLILSPFIFMLNYRMNHSVLMSLSIILVITFPFIVVGVLFLLNYLIKRKKKKALLNNETNPYNINL
jgi:hypothetical protein